MKHRKLSGGVACLTTISLVVISLAGTTVAASAEGLPDDVLAAVVQATPDTASATAQVTTTESGTDAIDATVAGAEVTVPVDPSSDISLGTDAGDLTIGLPFTDFADDATAEKNGVVSYDNNNGSTSVPVVTADGSLQINTVLHDPSAPSEYSYDLTIAGGGQIVPAGEGYAIVNGDNEPLVFIEEPWAKDANGVAIPTHYNLDGTTLTQVVDLSSTTVYPVVADPKFVWAYNLPTVKTTRSETRQLMGIGAGPAGVGSAAKACGAFVKAAGWYGGIICSANIVSIMYNATRAYNAGKCSQLLIGPGVIGTVAYKDSYCR